MFILKDIIKNLRLRLIEFFSLALVSVLTSMIFSFVIFVVSTISYQPKLICDNSIGDIVITSVIEGDDKSILDLQCYNNYSRTYDYNDFKRSQINPESIESLKSEWVESYSGRLKNIDYPARLLLPFKDICVLTIVTGVDFQELINIDSSLSDVHIAPDKKKGIILSETIVQTLRDSGTKIEVGDVIMVEGGRYLITTLSSDFAAPYINLEILAIIPDTGGEINAGTEDRHNSIGCYVDYDSMLKLIEPNYTRRETEEDNIYRLSQIDFLHPTLSTSNKSSLTPLPNQIFIRISKDKNIEEAIDTINNELEKRAKGKQRHIAMKAEDFLELGNYQYKTSEKVSSLVHQFFKAVSVYLISFIIFLFLLLILTQLTDRKRMNLQIKLGASRLWLIRYIVVRNLVYTAIPGLIGLITGLYMSFSYTEKTYGFRHSSIFITLSTYLLFLFLIAIMSSLIFFLDKKEYV